MKNIHPTREGKRFFIAVVLIGFASLNTGNNLIYLIFSMMLALSLVSFLVAVNNLRGLACSINFREPLYAGSPFKVDMEIYNKKKIHSYSFAVIPPVSMSRQLYCPAVRKGMNRITFNDIVIEKRGRYFLKDFRLRTGFPFIFIYILRTIAYEKELIVYPRIVDVSAFLLDMQMQFSDQETAMVGHEGDFLFSREYVYGEESRNIDWKATAKTQKTMIREFSKKDERFVSVILDNSGRAKEDDFEKAVSIAASLCSELIDADYYVRLITCGKIVPFGNGSVHLFKMLDILSAVQEIKVPECPVSEPLEGICILVKCSDVSSFSSIVHLCTGVVDARNL